MAGLASDAERLLVLDFQDTSNDAGSCQFVDDSRSRVSWPWALVRLVKATSEAASHLGIVYECGVGGKTTATFNGTQPTR